MSRYSDPLVIVGGLAAKHRERVRAFIRTLGAPTYAEALSGLREDADLPLIRLGERTMREGGFDYVFRIGNVPTVRFWRDLEAMSTRVVHYSDLPFKGLTRGELHPIESLVAPGTVDATVTLKIDAALASVLDAIVEEHPRSELGMIRALSQELPHGARVYLGNSLPIREWDLVATREPRGYTIEANRGANGIDGQLSTFFGQCDPERDNVCIIGDLTAIYDLNAPWIVPQLDRGTRFRIVIINNGGGRIFSRVGSLRALDPSMRERIIENVHGVHFEHWARMWGIQDRVTELIPDAEESRRVWKEYDELCSPSGRSRVS